MPIATKEILERGYGILFNKMYMGMLAQDIGMEAIFTTVESKKKEEQWPFIGSPPRLKEMSGPINRTGLNGDMPSIKNKKYGNSIEIDEDVIKFDNLNLYTNAIQGLALEAAKFPSREVIRIIVAGESYPVPIDGLPLFTNPTGVRVNDNLLTGSGTTVANIKADLQAVNSAMKQMVDDQGNPWDTQPNVIVCGPNTEIQFREIIASTAPVGTGFNSGNKNVFKGWYTDVISRAEIGGNDWYAAAADSVSKPFLHQRCGTPVFTLDDKNVKEFGKYLWIVKLYGKVEPTFPHRIIKVTNA